MQRSDMTPMVMRRAHQTSRNRIPFLVFIIFLIGLSISTQMFAWQARYHPILGAHWNHIYWPWSILQWSFAWHEQAYHMVRYAVSGGVTFCGLALLVVIVYSNSLRNSMKGNQFLYGSARWATHDDIKQAGLFSDEGSFVGGWEDEHGTQHYLRHKGSEHVMVIAPTRSGKGICNVIPTLLTHRESCVVTDLKGELWALTAGWRKRYAGNKVLRFEPAALDGSVSWNPMDEVRLGTVYETGDAQNLATMIIDTDGKGLITHWQKTSQSLLVGLILHLLYKRKNGHIHDASLAAVDAAISNPGQTLDELWDEMISYEHCNGKNLPVVARSAVDMKKREKEEAGSVISTLTSYLALYRDDVVAANTRSSGFAIRDLMQSEVPVSLYIITQPVDKDRMRPLVRIFISMICRISAGKMMYEETPMKIFHPFQKVWRLLRGQSIYVGGGRRGKGDYKHSLLLMLDEFPSLGKLSIIQETIAYLAGFGVHLFIIVQDIVQLRSSETGYGADESISSNCHIQTIYQPVRLETAQYASKLTGTTTILKKQMTFSGKRFGSALNHVSCTMQEVSRPLMTEDECMRMPPPQKEGDLVVKGGDMLVYVAGVPAIYGKQMPYFLDPVFQARCSVNPPLVSDRTIEEAPEVTLDI